MARSILSQNIAWFWENSKSFSPVLRMTPTRSRFSPANSQHRPLRSWLVTFQSSRWVDSEWSMLLTISRLIATSSTETRVTAFWASR